jgi:SAM-dependent methyltransferase
VTPANRLHLRAVDFLHGRMVFSRRTSVLAEALAKAIPAGTKSVLDVGCGDGTISALIARARTEISISGVDVLARSSAQIPVLKFDGKRLPFPDKSFESVMFIDVLHHTDNPLVLLKEAKRVAKDLILLKDHIRDGFLADPTLRFMDWVGNAPHGVALPYNYWSLSQWRSAFEEVHLTVKHWNDNIGLYSKPASWIFERNLHFLAGLVP